MLGFTRPGDVPVTVDDYIDEFELKTGCKEISAYARGCVINRISTRYEASLAIVKGILATRLWLNNGSIEHIPEHSADVEQTVLQSVADFFGRDKHDASFLYGHLVQGYLEYIFEDSK